MPLGGKTVPQKSNFTPFDPCDARRADGETPKTAAEKTVFGQEKPLLRAIGVRKTSFFGILPEPQATRFAKIHYIRNRKQALTVIGPNRQNHTLSHKHNFPQP